ncbi:MAG: tellurite resistance/C4-dicarboxylate transporter family protein [Planctomycetes bacterium]|nr:tellurite resistance/C4-dicarboxylate transporter family protein [Planctomycetota bacterium]
MEAAATQSASLPVNALEYVKQRLAQMHPAYFAMAMATGIVSLAADQLGLSAFARLLLWLNLPAYCFIWLAFVLRIALFPSRVLADLSSHQRGPGFFTAVAATSVVGTQIVLLLGNWPLALALWWLALVLWFGLTCAIFVGLSVKEEKPTLAEGINGGWLLAVVAPQSVVVLGCAVGADRILGHEISLFILMSLWLCGGMLYIWMISLIFFRYMFFKFVPSDLMPPYWINMGAVAISTLAGARLALSGGDVPLVASMLPFIKGLTLMFWATATWWIPILVILGVWRHRVRGFALKYDPLYWGLVFPLGMYSVCTLQLSKVLDVPFLVGLSRVFVVLALVAWVLTLFGLATRLLYVVLLAMRRKEPASTMPAVLANQQTGRLS